MVNKYCLSVSLREGLYGSDDGVWEVRDDGRVYFNDSEIAVFGVAGRPDKRCRARYAVLSPDGEKESHSVKSSPILTFLEGAEREVAEKALIAARKADASNSDSQEAA